jgi:hypothetical protein
MKFVNLEAIIINFRQFSRGPGALRMSIPTTQALIQLLSRSPSLASLEIRMHPRHATFQDTSSDLLDLSFPMLSNLSRLHLEAECPLISSSMLNKLLPKSNCHLRHLIAYQPFDLNLLEHISTLQSLETDVSTLMSLSQPIRNRLRNLKIDYSLNDAHSDHQALPSSLISEFKHLTSLTIIHPENVGTGWIMMLNAFAAVTPLRNLDLTMNWHELLHLWVRLLFSGISPLFSSS